MPVNPAFNSRSGTSRFMLFTKTMCRVVKELGPGIRLRYPSRPVLLSMLTLAEGVCELLPAAIQEQIEADAADLPVFDTPDGDLIPGQTT